MVRTRGASAAFLVGTTNPEPLGKLTKLPTIRETLQRCIHLVGELKSVHAALRATTDELLAIWRRTVIPVRMKSNVIDVLGKLHREWNMCKKNMKKDTLRKRNFQRKLDTLLDISSAKYEADDERAKEFLADQRGCRRFSLAAVVGTALRRTSAAVASEADFVDEDTGCPDPDYVTEAKRLKVDHPD